MSELDWRHSYNEAIAEYVEQLTQERSEDADIWYNVPGHRSMVRAGRLTDWQIETLAQRSAEIDTVTAINKRARRS
jgi:hypothetical protein